MKINRKGFTIVELVIVIAVVAILAAVMIPTFSNLIEKADDSAALQNAKTIQTEYLASLEGRDLDQAKNLVIKGDEDKFFVVKDGEFSSDIYSKSDNTADEGALTAFTGTVTSAEATGDFAGKVWIVSISG